MWTFVLESTKWQNTQAKGGWEGQATVADFLFLILFSMQMARNSGYQIPGELSQAEATQLLPSRRAQHGKPLY